LEGNHAIAAVWAGILGQDVDVELEVSRDELEHAGLVLADARLVFPAVRADLLGLGHVVLDTHFGQAIVIRLPRSAWFGWCFGITGRRRGRHDGKVDLFDLEEMPLPRGFH